MKNILTIPTIKSIKDQKEVLPAWTSKPGRLAPLHEFNKDFKKQTKIKQKRFQIVNKSMQMKSVNKVQLGRLNDTRYYFHNGIISLPFGHPSLEILRKEKQKYRGIHQKIQGKRYEFLKKEAEAIKNNERLNVLRQIFAQSPIFYILNSNLFAITKSWKTTREKILAETIVAGNEFYL